MADYYGMTSIDTAVVSDTGDLLIGLTDGNVINAGYVRGRPGPQGERGLMGPTGDPGRNGLDGAQLYTGVGMPADDMGKEGDLYIDLASRFLDIFQKTGGGWVVISSLRDASDSKGSGFVPGMSGTHDSDGGGGSSVIINNNDDGPAFGSDGSPLQPGDLWYNPDTGHLHVRSENNLEWIPIAGLPSAEFSADPPDEDRGGHPIEPGDLWWDTDLAALFVAALDSSDKIVWVVALPADRAAVPDEQNPFVLPFSADGTIATNPATGIRYIYHAAKNQWIDIPTTGNNIFYQEDAPSFENVNLGVGDLWVKESDKQVYVFDGISWKEVRARPKVYHQETPPAGVTDGELWWDSTDDELTLYIRYNDAWVPAAPPVSLDGINATIDAALIVQNDLLARVESGETAQSTLQDTVSAALDVQNTLKNRVEALEGTVVDGVWKYGSRAWPQNPGEFDLIDVTTNKTTVWQDATTLRLYNTDINGRVYTFSEVNLSDFIRIGAPGSSAVYRAMSAARPQGDYTEFLVEIVTHEDQAYESILNYNFEFLPAFDATAYATIQYVNEQDDLDVKKTGDTMTGNLNFTGGDRTITAQDGNRLRMGARDSSNSGRTFIDIQTADSSGTEGTDSGYRCKIYHLATPTAPLHAANKKYVDEQIAAIPAPTGGVPVGSIMIWMNSTAPDGWFKLQGETFDTVANPQLHTYLQSTTGYVAGTLPDWSGRYPGEYGDHISNPLGSKQNAKTGKPLTGGPRSSVAIPNGNTRTFTATGNTNAYSDGKSKVTIDENWDSVTRPPTVVVHYIIKHD